MRDFEDMDFVVAFKVNDTRGVFVEEVVCHHQAIVIAAQHYVVRPRVLAEANDRYLLQLVAVSGVQHHHLPGHERTNDQPVAALRSRHDLAHSAGR